MTQQQLRRQRRIVLLYLYVLFFLVGLQRGLTSCPPLTQLQERLAIRALFVLALAAQLGFMWYCTIDAKLVGKPLLALARLGIFFGGPLAVPVYLVWARGIRGLGLALLHGFLLLLLLACTAVAVGYLCYGEQSFA